MMKVEDIKVKMDNAYDKWQKRIATTKKFNDRAEKNWKKIVENGWDKYVREDGTINAYEVRRETNNDKAFDIVYAYDDAKRNAEESAKKEPEVEAVYKNWVVKYNNAIKFVAEIDEMPEIFKTTIKELATRWTGYDIERRERMKEARRAVDAIPYAGDTRKAHMDAYNAYRKQYSWGTENRLNKTDEEFYKINEDTAKDFMKDLVHRIKNKCGEITDMRNIHFSGNALNGYVEGTLGRAYVETIIAGGYNIQREHYRVLVK